MLSACPRWPSVTWIVGPVSPMASTSSDERRLKRLVRSRDLLFTAPAQHISNASTGCFRQAERGGNARAEEGVLQQTSSPKSGRIVNTHAFYEALRKHVQASQEDRPHQWIGQSVSELAHARNGLRRHQHS